MGILALQTGSDWMIKKQGSDDKQQKRSLLGNLFTKPDKDRTYREDLQGQWMALDGKGKVKFVLGVVIGLTLILGGLALVYWVMSLVVALL